MWNRQGVTLNALMDLFNFKVIPNTPGEMSILLSAYIKLQEQEEIGKFSQKPKHVVSHPKYSYIAMNLGNHRHAFNFST